MWPALCGMGPCQHRRDWGWHLSCYPSSSSLVQGQKVPPGGTAAQWTFLCGLRRSCLSEQLLRSLQGAGLALACLCAGAQRLYGGHSALRWPPRLTPILQGGWLPGPLAGVQAGPAPCTHPSGKQCLCQSTRPRRHTTRTTGPPPHPVEGLESRSSERLCGPRTP